MKLKDLKEGDVVAFPSKRREKEVEMSRRINTASEERRSRMKSQYGFSNGDLRILRSVLKNGLVGNYFEVVPSSIRDKVDNFVWDYYSDEFAMNGITDDEYPDWFSENTDRIIQDILKKHDE